MRHPYLWAIRSCVAMICVITAGVSSLAAEVLPKTQENNGQIQIRTDRARDFGEPESLQAVFSSGGVKATSPAFSLTATIGEPLTGVSYATDLQLVQGFWSSFSGKFSCCVGLRGNVDDFGDPNDPDMMDFVRLIDYLFISLEPLVCFEEGNLDLSLPEGNGSVTIADLTVMVDHFFVSLSPLPACP